MQKNPASRIPHWLIFGAIAPTIVTLEDICRALGITMAEFFTLPADVPSALTLEQRTLLSSWDMLTAEQRAAFLMLMQGCSENADR